MRKTFFLALILTAAALLLLPLAPANTAHLARATRDVLGSLRPAAQDPSVEPSPSVPPEPPIPPIDIHVDPPEIDLSEIDPPEIEPVEVDVHPEEIEQDVEHENADDHEGADHEDIDIDHDDPALNVRAEEKIEKSFPMPSAHRTLEIDNIWGSIEVVGTSSDQAKLTVNKSIRAESNEKLEQARKAVTLDITQQPDALKLYVNGPFRCDCHDCNHRDDDGYIVKMDFVLQVPRDIDIKIKTVNEGRVSVRDINGSFLVRNVNGDIQIHNIAGSGTARTVNGPVKVSFRQNPREASDFQTVNGNIELQFARDLSVDFRFKTFNGGIYSDFPVTAMPVAAMQQERRGGKIIFRADRYTGARIASGGPQIKVENLNGDIRILENHE
jgi:hypothetical protein